MAKVIITNLAEVKKQISEKFAKKIPSILKVAQLDLEDDLRALLLESFEQTLVIRGLKLDYQGDELRDVPAHIGLPDAEAVQAAADILEIIKSSFVFNKISTQRDGAIGFNVNLGGFVDKIMELQTGNTAGGESLPWMDWLINGGSVSAEIWFYSKPLKNDEGRSGRALMRFGEDLWDIDSYHKFVEDSAADNFVIEAIQRPEWRSAAEKLILDYLTQYLTEKRIVV